MPNIIYELVIILIGWLYPAYATYNSLNGSLWAQVNWMKYWIVFGIFNAFHFITGFLEPWVPFLSGFKLFMLCWLLPTLGSGSQFIHDDVLDPLLKRNKESINQTVNRISNISSTLLRELIKMIYHLLVDVVEQCWLLTRNANDIHVTPRLQVAINEVIAELHAARQAAIFMPRPQQQADRRVRLEEIKEDNSSNDMCADSDAPKSTPNALVAVAVSAHKAKDEGEEKDYEKKEGDQDQDENIEVDEIPIKTAGGAFRAAALSRMTDDSLSLRILLAEVLNAQRMQLGQQLSGQEHLAPINTSPNTATATSKPDNKDQCPSKPKRGKRKQQEVNAGQRQQLGLEMDQEVDRAYIEYCGEQGSR